MPSGVYERTEVHLKQCSRAGKISASKKRKLWECKQCGLKKIMPRLTVKKFCSKVCFDKFQTPDVPKSYGSIHQWMRRTFGTPSQCEHCGTTESKKFEWANISGQYELNRSDWARLCCRCHRRYDRGIKNKIKVLNV